MQRSSKTYSFEKDVYIIVVVTAAYRISEKNGKLIKDDVLITDINPRTLQGEVRDMLNHKLMILNTTNVSKNTPPAIGDWLDLIIQSMKNPNTPKINSQKPAIVRAAQLADFDDVSPEQLADAKIQEMRKVTVAIIEETMRVETEIKTEIKIKDEAIKKALKRGKLNKTEIAEDLGVSVEYIQKIGNEITDALNGEALTMGLFG